MNDKVFPNHIEASISDKRTVNVLAYICGTCKVLKIYCKCAMSVVQLGTLCNYPCAMYNLQEAIERLKVTWLSCETADAEDMKVFCCIALNRVRILY